MNASVNANNKRPAQNDETWGNLSTDAQRRWRANRTAQRKHRQQTTRVVPQYQTIPHEPFPPVTNQHDGQESLEAPAAVATAIPLAEGEAHKPNMAPPPPAPTTTSPISTLESFNQVPKSQTDELFHLLDFPPHMGLPSPGPHDMSTPSYHLPRPSEEPNDPATVETRFTPTSHPGDTPRSFKTDPSEVEPDNLKLEIDKADGRSRIPTNSPTPTYADPSTEGVGRHKPPPLEEDMRYMPTPLSSLVSPHPSNSKTSLTDLGAISTNDTTPSGSPRSRLKSPGLSAISSGLSLAASPAVGGLGIMMKLPENQASYVSDAGETALHKAAAGGHEMITRLLLEGGADRDVVNAAGRRALHLAAENGHLRVVSVLVDAGADVEAADATGARPLHIAAMHGHEDVARFLLWKGAQVNASDRAGKS